MERDRGGEVSTYSRHIDSRKPSRSVCSEANVPVGKYSDTLVEHVMAPRNGGGMDGPDLTGHAGRPDEKPS